MDLRTFAPFALLAVASCGGTPAAAPPPVAPSPPVAPPPAPVTATPSVSGIWLGAIHLGGSQALRIQLQLDLTATPPRCVLDSLDQHSFGIPCTNAAVAGTSLTFDVPAVHGALKGTISADGNTLEGTWTQGQPLPFQLTRQAAAIAPTKAALDPAMPPVDVTKIQEVLDKDLAATLDHGDLAPATGGGVTIGVVSHGVRRVFSYGPVKPDSVFEIGSITKTFTGLILAQMVAQKKVRFDEPVRALLPPGTVAAPASGAEITLLDLSAQRSGLPRMPDNFKPADPTNPYVDYDAKALYAFLGTHGVALPAKPEFGYSNLGMGLLGQALAVRAGSSYEALLKKEITSPLGLKETVVTLTPALLARFAPGHDGEHKPAHAWDLDALAGAGAIRSTAGDMLTYLEAQLHPEHLPAASQRTPEGKTLSGAITTSHESRGEVDEGSHIALNWFHIDDSGTYWHNGATGGYSAFALFNPGKDYAVVVLSNTSVGGDSFVDKLGPHVAQRLTGDPASSLLPAAP